MKKIKKINLFLTVVLSFLYSNTSAFSHAGMVALEDEDLRDVSGKGLFVADMIRGDELTGRNEYSTPFNFYRVGMDGEMRLNMNISKLQLGCGGINDHLSGYAGCDIDIDYATLMGRDPDLKTEPGDPISAFILDRPYMEFAIKNDDTRTQREVVGIKIGAARADGAITGGRRYDTNGMVNHENTALAGSCDPSASTGSGVVGCHSGINTVSGFLGSELSLRMDATGVLDLPLLPAVNLSVTGCVGRTQIGHDACEGTIDDALFVDLAGTRMQTLGLRSASLKANHLETDLLGGLLDGVVSAILSELSAQMSTDLRSVHKMTLEDTPDFFLSFQREPVAYPRFNKMTPTEELAGTTEVFDACAPGSNFATPRCGSAYSVPSNTGWWMNIPTVKLLDVYNPNIELPRITSIDDVTALLGAPGLMLENPEFNLTPAQNCYGSSAFC